MSRLGLGKKKPSSDLTRLSCGHVIYIIHQSDSTLMQLYF